MSTSLKKLKTWGVEGFYTRLVMISPSIKYAYKPRPDGLMMKQRESLRASNSEISYPVVVRDKKSNDELLDILLTSGEGVLCPPLRLVWCLQVGFATVGHPSSSLYQTRRTTVCIYLDSCFDLDGLSCQVPVTVKLREQKLKAVDRDSDEGLSECGTERVVLESAGVIIRNSKG